MSYESNLIEAPVWEVDKFYHEDPTFILHNYVNTKGKLLVNKIEAALLMAALKEFIENN